MSKITFEEAAAKAIEFRNDRDWKQFHNPKDLAISVSLEASELLELFQWSGADLEAARKKPEMTEELADVMIYCIYMANALNIDIPEAIRNKIDKNAAKYRSKRQRANQRSTRNSKSDFQSPFITSLNSLLVSRTPVVGAGLQAFEWKGT